jgi:ABC-type bacteriocin/lantibiotic exporter with double-glycine peptidase domain
MARVFSRPVRIERTGDDTPAASLYGYVWRMSGWHQVWLSLIAALVAGLSMAPLELQRRIINDAISQEDLKLLGVLGAIYLAVLLVQAGLKYLLRVYQGWLSESAIRYTRKHLSGIHECRRSTAGEKDEGGQAVSIIGAEVELLGGFVGAAVAEPLVNGGMMVAVLGYMLTVEPVLAAASLAFLIPQAILVPIIQRIVNRLVEERIGLLRDLGDRIARSDEGEDKDRQVDPDEDFGLDDIYGNRIRVYLLKYASKSIVNLFNGLSPIAALVIGGYLVIIGETTIGVVVAFISGFERLADPLRQIIAFYRLAAQSSVRHDKIASWM